MPPHSRWQTASLLIGIGVIGLGIGWLAGMSLSPVIANIIAAIVTATAAIVAAVSGLEEKKTAQAEAAQGDQTSNPSNTTTVPQSRTAEAITATGRLRVNPWPLAVLLVGMFFGTSAGNFARANDLFGKRVPLETPLTTATLEAEIEPWVTQGISKTLVVQRLFELKYPSSGTASLMTATDAWQAWDPNPDRTGLYTLNLTIDETACDQIARTSNNQLEKLILGEETEDGTRQGGLENAMLQELFVTLESPERFRDVVRILCASAQ